MQLYSISRACALTMDPENCFFRYLITNDATEACQMILTSHLTEDVRPISGKGVLWRHGVQVTEAGLRLFLQHYQVPLVPEHEDWGVVGDVRGAGHYCTVPFKNHQTSRCKGYVGRVCKENARVNIASCK